MNHSLKKLFSLLFFVFFFIWGGFISFGAEVNWTHRLEGSSIVLGTLELEDDDYNLLGSGFVDAHMHSYIRLGLAERKGMSYTGNHSYSLEVTITPYDNFYTALAPVTQVLVIDYNKNGMIGTTSTPTGPNANISDYRMSGVYKYDVTINWIKRDGIVVSSFPDYVYLEGGFSSERYYRFDEYVQPLAVKNFINYSSTGQVTLQSSTSGITNAQTDEIYLSWSYIAGAERYELEWCWVDNYDVSSLSAVLPASAISLTESEFRHNSTRISTGNHYYRLPNVFGRGYLVYRVRAVGRWSEDVTKQKYGRWSSDPSFGGSRTWTFVSDWSHVITIGVQHEEKKNWQYQATYAEDGKKKEVTQYFDGSLRGRQTVTRISSQNQSVVGETVYDNEGRAVVQVLPVPQENPAIRFYPNLNLRSGTTTAENYSHLDFDWESTTTTACLSTLPGALSINSGASQYYSSTYHQSDDNWQQYVADAEEYPFTQIEYTPDNTGRIRNQSGVGLDYTIGSGRETYYFYSTPSQTELNRLFGYKVGEAARYKKNMVIDANGQVSISYLDAQGRVVATSLADNTTPNLKALSSESDVTHHHLMTTDILNKLDVTATDTPIDNNYLISTGNFSNHQDALVVTQQLPVIADNAPYDFDYDVKTSSYTEDCNGLAGVDFPYIYDLKVSIKSDCGEELFSQTYEHLIGDQLLGTDDYNFVDNVVFPKRGTYTLSKELVLNKEKFEEYKAIYLNRDLNVCLEDSMEAIFSPCDPGETCEECADNLGTLSAYLSSVSEDPLSSEETTHYTGIYNAKLEACWIPCRILTSCEAYSSTLLNDMRPEGQYGSLSTSSPDPLSVYNENNILGVTNTANLGWHWRNPASSYKSSTGIASMIDIYYDGATYSPAITTSPGTPGVIGNFQVLPTQLANVSDFVQAFYANPQWAESLVNYHPEYKLYQYTLDMCNVKVNVASTIAAQNPLSLSSEEYDQIVRGIFTFTEANTANPQGLDLTSAVNQIYTLDPYFHTTYANHPTITVTSGSINLTTKKNALMTEAMANYRGSGMTMFQFACKTVICGNNYGGCAVPTSFGGLSALHKDDVWQIYKGYYLAEKGKINQLLMDLYGFRQSPGFFNGCIGDGDMSIGALSSFTNSSHYGSLLAVLMKAWAFPSGSYGSPAAMVAALNNINYPPVRPIFDTDRSMCSPLFEGKTIRIVRNTGSMYNEDLSPQQVIDEITPSANYEQWLSTGLCPLASDMERLLNALGVQGKLKLSTPASTVNEYVPNLFTAMMGYPPLSSSAMTISGQISGTNLVLSFVSNTSSVAAAQVTLPQLSNSTGSLSWSNYAGGSSPWYIYSMGNSFPIAGTNNMKIMVEAGANPSTAQQYVITYSTTGGISLNLNGCAAEYAASNQNDPDCKTEEYFELDIKSMMQNLIAGSHFMTSSAYTVNTTAYTNSILPNFFGPSASWTGSSSPSYLKVTGANGRILLLNIAGGTGSISSLSMISTFNITPTAAGSSSGTFQLTGISNSLTSVQLNGTFSYHTLDAANRPVAISLDLSCGCNTAYNPITGGANPIGGGTSLPNGSASRGQTPVSSNGIPLIDCPCIPQWQAPISCTDAYASYLAVMNNLLPANSISPNSNSALSLTTPGGSTNPTGPTSSSTDYTIEQTEFCDYQLASITNAYLSYLSSLSVNSVNHPMYISITEFGMTNLGYSNSLLSAAVAAYSGSSYASYASSQFKEWSTYVNTIYLPALNPQPCPPNGPSIEIPSFDIEMPCNPWTNNTNAVNAQNQNQIYLNQMAIAFEQAYVEGAMASVKEQFNETHFDKEYHYTLYYYDRAGNLQQTVPPKGVDRLEYNASGTPVATTVSGMFAATNTAINQYRNANPTAIVSGTHAPNHAFETIYRYNSLNQLVYQKTPDGGESKFAYDKLGRLVMSQNDKQAVNDKFSYTLYDGLGRVVEVGEMAGNSAMSINSKGKAIGVNVEADNWVNVANYQRQEVTISLYDALNGQQVTVQTSPTLINVPVETQFDNYHADNTRNRIVGVLYLATHNNSNDITTNYNSATYYDYDIHGNVSELIQVNNNGALITNHQNIKKMEYTYDLVSGNVDRMTYQKDREDQFIHRYHYDSDNRITVAETSSDGFVFEKDAKYFYYDHGPLARTEIADKKVQAMDYAYTIQGWLKTVNGEQIGNANMMGEDAQNSTINSQVAKDAFGFSLNYYQGDYVSANTTMLMHSIYSNPALSSGNYWNLYNGNIRSMFTALMNTKENDPTTATTTPILATHQTVYEYDQLNRIKEMKGYNRTWSGTTSGFGASNYASTYSFDADGNLTTLTRTAANASGNAVLMDNFAYHYNDPFNLGENNRLSGLTDAAGASAFGNTDIDNSITANNYTYDQIGQLLSDANEGIANIQWTVTNKVKVITKTNAETISFDYDPMGNRIAKHHMDVAGSVKSTFYALDAQGNTISVYEVDDANTTTQVHLIERNIYGSSRVGQEQMDKIMNSQPMFTGNSYLANNFIGDKHYELFNHLGNVLVVVTDRKLPEQGTGSLTGKVAYYNPDVVSMSDYYPFGMQMPNRHSSQSEYRYGYQGSEKDDEVKGSGNSYTTHFRQLDPRVGRWLTIDPEKDNWSDESPYVSMGDNPIIFNDPDGDCPWCAVFDYAWQVGSNLVDGKSAYDAFVGDVDFVSVLVSAVPGGKGIMKLAKIGGEIYTGTHNTTANNGVERKSTKEIILGAATKGIAHKATSKLKKMSSDDALKKAKEKSTKIAKKVNNQQAKLKKKPNNPNTKKKIDNLNTKLDASRKKEVAVGALNKAFGKLDEKGWEAVGTNIEKATEKIINNGGDSPKFKGGGSYKF